MKWFKPEKEEQSFYPSLYQPDDLLDFKRVGERIHMKVNGTPVDSRTLADLQIEANQIKNSHFWELMVKRLRVMAMTQALKTSKNWEEVLAAKAAADNVNQMEAMITATLDATTDEKFNHTAPNQRS